ncbi:hypothetical protein O1M54_50970 [Streptomyces diastatochromogenes]|nr:hypothetical protein [Streptomyces diastatochromogenes]
MELYEKAGSPPQRTMAQRAGGYGALPRSTAHRIVNKQAVPHGLQQFQAYMRACEVPEAEWPDWEAAWTRAWRQEKQNDLADLTIAARDAYPSATARALAALYTETPGLNEMRYLRKLRELQEADGHLYVTSNGVLHRAAAEVKHHSNTGLRRGRRRPGRSPQVPERPVPGQLSIPIGDPESEAAAPLF